jgi:hypothetical protein
LRPTSINRGKPYDRQFKVGDKIRVNLHHGKIEEAVVRFVIQHTDSIKLQVDVCLPLFRHK